jgi:hypothetical protein
MMHTHGSLSAENDLAKPILPALIVGAGDRAALRFLEFFAVNIRNRNRRVAIHAGCGCLTALV